MIMAKWVKGHYTGKDKEFKHELNEIADSLATTYNSHPHPKFIPSIKPLTYPNYGARVLYEGSTITNKLRPIMAQALHHKTMIAHIQEK
jgi:hypothetical protein